MTRQQRNAAVAATAFANSQALPLLIIDIVGPQFGPTGADLGSTYIGLYLVVYLVLQWTIGASLLEVPMIRLGGGGGSPRLRPTLDASASCSDGVAMLAADGAGEMLPTDEAVEELGAAPTAPRRRRGRELLLGLHAFAGRVASPPLLGIGAGLLVGLTPPLRALCITEGAAAPLDFAMQAKQVRVVAS